MRLGSCHVKKRGLTDEKQTAMPTVLIRCTPQLTIVQWYRQVRFNFMALCYLCNNNGIVVYHFGVGTQEQMEELHRRAEEWAKTHLIP